MRRGRPGVAGLKRQTEAKKSFQKVGQEIEAGQLEHIGKQLVVFKEKLEQFAKQHKHEINQNPRFRAQFQKMCVQVGVDPLASQKGFWAQMLGVGDFYYELSVQVVDVCMSTRIQNGGLLSMEELQARLRTKRGKLAQEVSEDDIYRAVAKIACLGNGFQILAVGARKMVVSVPCELNRDHTALLELAQGSSGGGAFVTLSSASTALQWPKHRVEAVLNLMLQESMVWIDDQAAGERQFWFPSLFFARLAEAAAASSGTGSGSGAGLDSAGAGSASGSGSFAGVSSAAAGKGAGAGSGAGSGSAGSAGSGSGSRLSGAAAAGLRVPKKTGATPMDLSDDDDDGVLV